MFTVMVVVAVVALVVIGFLMFGSGRFQSTIRVTSQDRQLLANGVPASARILAVEDTYTRVSSNPLVRFRLEVQPKDGRAYETTTEAIVSVVDLPRFQPGTSVEVKVDPDDAARVALVVR
jgi:hypothetical protein